MKKQLLSVLFACFLIIGTQNVMAQDGYFSNAKALEKGTFAIGIQPVVLTEQNDFMMIIRGSYGLIDRMTGHFKVGLFDEELYAGAHLETNLLTEPQSAISIAVLTGVYTYGDPGLNLGVNFSKDFDPMSIYTGISYQPLFVNSDITVNAFLLPVGLDYHVRNAPVDLMLEADIPLNDDAEYLEALTFGARIYLN